MFQFQQPDEFTGMKCYFNLVSSTDRIIDPEGVEVEDLESAWVQALKAIEELRSEESIDTSEWVNWRLEAMDEAGSLLFSINLGVLAE